MKPLKLHLPGSLRFSFTETGQLLTKYHYFVSDKDRVQLQSDTFPSNLSYWSFENFNNRQFESVSYIYSHRRVPKHGLFFILLDCKVVQARKYDTLFEKERRLEKEKLGVRISSLFSEFSLKLLIRDLLTPLTMELYLSIENRVFPPELLRFPLSNHEIKNVWMLHGQGISISGQEHQPYLQADVNSNFTLIQNHSIPRRIFPRDLFKIHRGTLDGIRNGQYKTGACVMIFVLQILWARLSFLCPNSCKRNDCKCEITEESTKFECLVEIDDGTDQCQLFAEGKRCYSILNLSSVELFSRCGRFSRYFGSIDFKLNVECEPESPQGIFRSLLVNRPFCYPRRAYLMRDRMKSKQTKLSNPEDQFSYSYIFSTDNEDYGRYELVDDHAKYAYVKTSQNRKAKTNVREKMLVKLFDIDNEPQSHLDIIQTFPELNL